MADAADERLDAAKRRVGRTLCEKWRLERLLGVGGMAAVYAATHRNNLKTVAIKMLHPELSAHPDVKRRFLREGYIANRVGHPGAVSVLDDGTDDDDGAVFFVMELCEGETLQARNEAFGGRIPPAELLELTDKLLDVLVAAHDQGIVHRDLKPDNVFITNDGQVKVLDFGIARLLDATEGTTQAGVLMGTPAYMPPEQVKGLTDRIDGRTDLWAVGAILFSLLTGRRVHEATAPGELIVKAMTDAAPKLATVLPSVHPAIAAVVDRALAFEQDGRFPDARAMQRAVRDALAQIRDVPLGATVHAPAAASSDPLPIVASAASGRSSQPAPSRARKRRGLLALGLVVFAVFAASVAGARARSFFAADGVVDAARTLASEALSVGEVDPQALAKTGVGDGPAGEPLSSAVESAAGGAAGGEVALPLPSEGALDAGVGATGDAVNTNDVAASREADDDEDAEDEEDDEVEPLAVVAHVDGGVAKATASRPAARLTKPRLVKHVGKDKRIRKGSPKRVQPTKKPQRRK
jgi:serine/threonine-protein kinase